MIAGLVLAAGAATRFGGPKQLAELDGRPLLEHALRAMAAAPVDRVVVVLGSGADEIVAGADLHGADPLVCPRWEKGQAASLACGLAALAEADAVVVTLGDQPRMSTDAIRRVIERRNGAAAVRATYAGEPGHPVLLESELFDRLRDVSGDLGARNLLMSVHVHDVPCDDLGGGEDVDTPAELDALRAGGPVTGSTLR
ncbi:MAG TPA: nucleotidyltransferase family protein [Thermoleophilaceae bacterium]|nr:nucleotidyltransferase family protein [Thermoleophilaceae bacterium]